MNRTKSLAFKDPVVRKHIAENGLNITFGRDRPNSYGFTDWGEDIPVTIIRYNQMRFKQKQLHAKSVQNDIDVGHFMKVPKNQLVNYVPTHEIGHVLHNALYEKTHGNKNADMRNQWLEGVIKDIYNEAIEQTKLTAKELRTSYLSSYSGYNNRELFAELYTHSKLGVDKNPMSEAFAKIIKKL